MKRGISRNEKGCTVAKIAKNGPFGLVEGFFNLSEPRPVTFFFPFFHVHFSLISSANTRRRGVQDCYRSWPGSLVKPVGLPAHSPISQIARKFADLISLSRFTAIPFLSFHGHKWYKKAESFHRGTMKMEENLVAQFRFVILFRIRSSMVDVDLKVQV